MAMVAIRVCRLLQFGPGMVGREFARQLGEQSSRLATEMGLAFRFGGLFGRKGGLVAGGDGDDATASLGNGELALFDFLGQGGAVSGPQGGMSYCSDPMDLLDGAMDRGPALPWSDTFVVDTSTGASSSLFPFMERALARGSGLIVANKKLLAGAQEEFTALARFGPRRLMLETTVGAGLPVISTLRSLLASGDEIIEISGCMSGTLGYICSRLEQDLPFSESVRQAREQGFAEPDPRVDLSGQDVARKALILARVWRAERRRREGVAEEPGRSGGGSVAGGGAIELEQIPTEPLFPSEMACLDTDEFLRALPDLDRNYAQRMRRARSRGRTLRYTARVSGDGCRVGLEEVALDGGLGRSLQGPENVFQFRTRRYREHPLIVQGPGAGPEVTAAGVVSDLLVSAGAL